MSGTVVHLLECPTLVRCSNLEYQVKGHHVPLLVGVVVEVQALRWVAYHQLVFGSSFVVVAHLISSHLTMRIAVANDDLRRLFFCDNGE